MLPLLGVNPDATQKELKVQKVLDNMSAKRLDATQKELKGIAMEEERIPSIADATQKELKDRYTRHSKIRTNEGMQLRKN